MELTAICDINEKVKKRLGDDYAQYPFYTDYKELIDSADIDAVIVAVPHRLHAKIAIYALSKGKHVLVEKPVDISVTEARKLNDAAQKSNAVFSIMFNQRANPLFKKAREIVKGGKLGELKRTIWIVTNWYRRQSYYDSGSWRATWAGEGGGVLINQAPHNLDLWQWICGMPMSLSAHCDVAKFHNIEVEDDVTIFTRYANGATGTFITSTGENPGTNRLEISGTLGKLVLENGVIKWWKLKKSEREFCFENSSSESPLENDYEEITFDINNANHIEILNNFSDAIRTGAELIAPGIEGINELMLSNAAYLSEWTGNTTIDLPLDGRKFDEILKEKAKNSRFHNETEENHTGEYKKRWSVQW